MLVQINQTLAVTELFELGRFGSLALSPLLAALMEVLLANVVFCPPEPYRGLLVALRLKFPPMIEVPLVFFLITTSWGVGFIQYLVSEVCFTAQTRDAVVERIGRMTVLCPRAIHVGVVPRDIVVGVRVHHPHMWATLKQMVHVSTRVTLWEWCCW